MSKNNENTFESICQVMDAFENPILIDKITLNMSGDLATASVLSRLRYWFSPSKKNGQQRTRIIKEGKTWVARTKEEWWEECGVTCKQMRRIAKKLKDLKLVEIKYFRFNGLRTSHWHLNIQEYARLYNKTSNLIYGSAQRARSVVPKGHARSGPKGTTHNTPLKHPSYTSTYPNTAKSRKKYQTTSVQVSLLSRECHEIEECFNSQSKALEWLMNFGFEESKSSEIVKLYFNRLLPSVFYLRNLMLKDKKPINDASGYLLQIIENEWYLKFSQKRKN